MLDTSVVYAFTSFSAITTSGKSMSIARSGDAAHRDCPGYRWRLRLG
jgi:hypothetical protein